MVQTLCKQGLCKLGTVFAALRIYLFKDANNRRLGMSCNFKYIMAGGSTKCEKSQTDE